ncbi:hypothetical protein BJ912DRAFT_818302, partial [Pholiota molesta]
PSISQLVWPPRRDRSSQHQAPPLTPITTHVLNAPLLTPSIQSETTSTRTPASSLPDKLPKKQKRNGYDVAPKALGFAPYSLTSRGRPTRAAFAINGTEGIQSQAALSNDDWNRMALDAGIITAGSHLCPFQIDAANSVLGRSGDLVVIAPTGMGKSLVWDLPLLAQEGAISLVLVPYTT